MQNPFSILLIDDEKAQLLSLKRFLARRGYEVYTAENGQEGLDVASS